MPEPTAADLKAAEAVVIEWSSGDLSPTRQRDLIAQALATQRAELAALLRTCAAGRTEYAGGYSLQETNHALRAQRAALESEACALEAAAKVVEGDVHAVMGLLPSWRWTEEMRARLSSPASGEPARA